MVLAVLRSRELHEGLKRFPERTTYRVLHPELKGYWKFFGRVDVGRKLFLPRPGQQGHHHRELRFSRSRPASRRIRVSCEFDHVGFWDLRIAVADQYRYGRIFIAGDAAHSHPPYGGFGLNSGLEDVTNLGWKLAATLQGWGAEALLDSYGQERRPIFVETGQAVIAGGIEKDREFLDRYNPENDRAEFERAWKAQSEDRRAPAAVIRAALRRLISNVGPARWGVQHPRQVFVPGSRRPPSNAADAFQRAQRVRRAWLRLYAARFRGTGSSSPGL